MNQSILLQISPEELDMKLEKIIEKVVYRVIESQDDKLLTRSEAARLIGKSTQTIKRMQERGDIVPINTIGHPKYSRNSILNYKKNNK